jgi:hypothetical protein
MSAPATKPRPTACPASHHQTLGQRDTALNPGTDRGTNSGTVSLKALADSVLERYELGQREKQRVGQSPIPCPTQGTTVGQQSFSESPSNKGFTEENTSVPLFKSGGLGQRDSDALPDGCPLDGWPFPETGCRFHRRLFERLTAEGVLPAGGPCPLRGVCKLGRE